MLSLFLSLALLAGPIRAADSVEIRLAALEDKQAIHELVVGEWKFAKREIIRDVPPEAPRRGAPTSQ